MISLCQPSYRADIPCRISQRQAPAEPDQRRSRYLPTRGASPRHRQGESQPARLPARDVSDMLADLDRQERSGLPILMYPARSARSCGSIPVRIRQILLNLLVNASALHQRRRHHHPKSSSMIRRSIVSVIDTGIGLSEADIKHVFEEFYQVGRLRRDQGEKGSGLGLTLSRELIRLHGGSDDGPQRRAYRGLGSRILFLPAHHHRIWSAQMPDQRHQLSQAGRAARNGFWSSDPDEAVTEFFLALP